MLLKKRESLGNLGNIVYFRFFDIEEFSSFSFIHLYIADFPYHGMGLLHIHQHKCTCRIALLFSISVFVMIQIKG